MVEVKPEAKLIILKNKIEYFQQQKNSCIGVNSSLTKYQREAITAKRKGEGKARNQTVTSYLNTAMEILSQAASESFASKNGPAPAHPDRQS